MTSTSTYDVLVLGAGPAGSAAAWQLARSGLRVALVDQHTFPRDKVCGDGLIADALHALDAMGLLASMEHEAARYEELRLYSPSGKYARLGGRFLSVPRYRFDQLLVEAAVHAGATLHQQVTALAPLESGGIVVGAACKQRSATVDFRARVTILATGANATVLSAFGFRVSSRPHAVAGRAYFRVPATLASSMQYLSIVYGRELCPGYGWIFPGPDGRFNVGVGFFAGDGATRRSLHALWNIFAGTFEPVMHLIAASERLTPFRGAPLRTGLTPTSFGRPGLIAIGEAIDVTYPATGEGIGKAMDSGLRAARHVADAFQAGGEPARVHERFEAEFRQNFTARYAAYAKGQRWSSRPWLVNLLTARANAGTFVREELEDLVAERGDPMRMFSTVGLVRGLIS